MKNLVKALVICAALLAGTMTVSAQSKGEMAAGVNLAVGTGNDFTNYGIGAKFQYNVMDNLRLEPSFTYFFKKDYVSCWDLDLNAHYLFNVADGLTIYPLAGVGVYGTKVKYAGISSSDSKFIGNVGAGAEFALTDAINLGLDYKYKFGSDSFDRSVLSIGVSKKF